MTQLVLLAGGYGTRSMSYANGVPKALIPVRGRPALHWHLVFAEAVGFSSVLVLASHLGDQITEFVSTSTATSSVIPVTVVREPIPSGTAGALRTAIDSIEESFVLGNADTFVPIRALLDLVNAGARGACAMAFTPAAPGGPAPNLLVDGSGRVVAYDKNGVDGSGRQLPGTDAGYGLWRVSLLADVLRNTSVTSFETGCVPRLLSELRIQGIEVDEFNDFGTARGYAGAGDFIGRQLRDLDAVPG